MALLCLSTAIAGFIAAPALSISNKIAPYQALGVGGGDAPPPQDNKAVVAPKSRER
jgi:hypothetical protein